MAGSSQQNDVQSGNWSRTGGAKRVAKESPGSWDIPRIRDCIAQRRMVEQSSYQHADLISQPWNGPLHRTILIEAAREVGYDGSDVRPRHRPPFVLPPVLSRACPSPHLRCTHVESPGLSANLPATMPWGSARMNISWHLMGPCARPATRLDKLEHRGRHGG